MQSASRQLKVSFLLGLLSEGAADLRKVGDFPAIRSANLRAETGPVVRPVNATNTHQSTIECLAKLNS